MLSFPDRFYAAVQFVKTPPPGAASTSEDTKLALYALHQQATVGPCTGSKAWTWGMSETAKHTAWKSLGDMASVEAMRLYVRTIEMDNKDWQAMMRGPGAGPAGGAALAGGLAAVMPSGDWAAVATSGRKPAPRYQHAAAVVTGRLIVVGGNSGGRYLGDVHALEASTLAWSRLEPRPALPARAGSVAVPWGGATSLLLIGGLAPHVIKGRGAAVVAAADPGDGALAVITLDVATLVTSPLATTGPSPTARLGHSATLVNAGSHLVVFGGEDASRRVCDDTTVLDLATKTWSRPPAADKGGPSPRAGHAAVAVAGGAKLLLFGGGSPAQCYADLWVLDTTTWAWTRVPLAAPPPAPRAGCASTLLGSMWYITGGGDGTKGLTDTLALDVANWSASPGAPPPPLTWRVAALSPPHTAVTAEGATLVSLTVGGAVTRHLLLAYGGYTGRYHTDVHALAPVSSGVAGPLTSTPTPVPQPGDGAHAEKAPPAGAVSPGKTGAPKAAEPIVVAPPPAPDGAAQELLLVRRQLAAAQRGAEEADKELGACRAALTAEQARAFRLEVTLAEAQQALTSAAELESELAALRKRYAADAGKKVSGGAGANGGGGFWGFLAGEAAPAAERN